MYSDLTTYEEWTGDSDLNLSAAEGLVNNSTPKRYAFHTGFVLRADSL
jgi:hypothetical protein